MMTIRALLINLLVLVQTALSEHGGCPFSSRCHCSEGSYGLAYSQISCIDPPFSQFPVLPDGKVFSLQVKDANLGGVDSGTFGNVVAASVSILNSNIYHLGNDSFFGMNNSLEYLNLDSNKLHDVPIGAFKPLERLKRLSLQSNEISSVSMNWAPLTSTLSELLLGDNQISSMPLDPENTLKNFSSLLMIELDNNFLRNLDDNSLPISLTTLSISDNLLKDFPSSLLNHLPNLKRLILKNNLINDIPNFVYKVRLEMEELDLSYNLITLVDNFSNYGFKIIDLNLAYNDIKIIRPDAFRSLDCKKINLSFNRLSELDDNAFTGVESTLVDLNMAGNKMLNIPNSIKQLKKLKTLNLSNNIIVKINDKLSQMSDLETLFLSGNYLEIIPFKVLNSLKQIKHLDLSYNRIADIRSSDFRVWSKHLEKLSLQSNSIYLLEKNTFKETSVLSELNLSFNAIYLVDEHAFDGLEGSLKRLELSFSLKNKEFPSALKHLKSLRYLALDNNNIAFIPLYIVNLEHLQHLILDFNNIRDIPNDVFDVKAHRNLEVIRFSFNQIRKLDDYTFSDLPKLQEIVLNDNKIRSIDENAFKNLISNLSIYLSNNKIDKIDGEAFVNIPQLRLLDLHSNELQSFDFSIFRNVTDELHPMMLNLSSNHIEAISPTQNSGIMNHFNTSKSLFVSVLDLSHNLLTKMPSDLNIRRDFLRKLDLGYNAITVVETEDLNGMSGLELLTIVHNKISTLRQECFKEMKNLQYLNLSHNHIEYLQNEQFKNIENLKVLDLSFNNIGSIQNDVFDNTKLERLILSNNKLSIVSLMPYAPIGNSLKQLDFSYNQITEIGNIFHNVLPKLVELNLCNNKLTIDSGMSFENITYLSVLELCANEIVSLKFLNNDNATVMPSKLKYLNLANCNLMEAPLINVSSVVSLNLSGNKISNVNNTFLSGLPKLKILNLSGNNLNGLSGLNWSLSSNLTDLDLSSNPIKDLNRGSFAGLTNLHKLNLQNLDSLASLESDTLSGLSLLSVLKIQTQKKSYWLSNILSGLPHLKELTLLVTEEKLTDQLPKNFPSKLKYLEITGKQLKEVTSDSLKGLKELKEVQLSIVKTAIKTFPKWFLWGLRPPKLSVDLSNNGLEHVGPEVLYKTLGQRFKYGTKAYSGGINIDGNPLVCGCDAEWFGEWLKRYLVETKNIKSQNSQSNMELYEYMKQYLCHDTKTGQKFPILTYDEIKCAFMITPKESYVLKSSNSNIKSINNAILLIASIIWYINPMS